MLYRNERPTSQTEAAPTSWYRSRMSCASCSPTMNDGPQLLLLESAADGTNTDSS